MLDGFGTSIWTKVYFLCLVFFISGQLPAFCSSVAKQAGHRTLPWSSWSVSWSLHWTDIVLAWSCPTPWESSSILRTCKHGCTPSGWINMWGGCCVGGGGDRPYLQHVANIEGVVGWLFLFLLDSNLTFLDVFVPTKKPSALTKLEKEGKGKGENKGKRKRKGKGKEKGKKKHKRNKKKKKKEKRKRKRTKKMQRKKNIRSKMAGENSRFLLFINSKNGSIREPTIDCFLDVILIWNGQGGKETR